MGLGGSTLGQLSWVLFYLSGQLGGLLVAG